MDLNLIDVTYVIESVDEPNHCMMVKYESVGREHIMCSVPIPWTTDDIHQVILNHAPINVWQMREKEKQQVEVGITGSFQAML